MKDFIKTFEEHNLLFASNNEESNPVSPKPVTETEDVEEDVRPGGERENNPRK